MKLLDAYKKAFRDLPSEIYAAEAVAETESELTVTLQNGAHSGSAASDVTSLFVRTQGEKGGFAYTQNLEEDPKEVLKRAHESSLYAQTEGLPIPGVNETTYMDMEPECELTDIAVLWKKAEAIDQWMTEHASGLSLRQLSVTDRIRTISVVNSKGRDCRTSSHCFCVSLFAADSRYPGNFLVDELTFSSVEEIADDIWARKLERWYWNAEAQQTVLPEFTSGSYRCILGGTVMNYIFITGWRMFTAGNYQKSTTPFSGQLQSVIAGPAVNITDRVSRAGSGYLYRADCEGTKGRDAMLVTDGVMTGCMSSLTDCGKDGSTGNGGRKDMISGTIHTDVVTMPKNFGIEPGAGTLEDLIETLSDGIYIYESFDQFHSVNTVSGECSIPCNGILIKDGKPTGTVKGLTINGKVQDILKEITALDDEVQVQPMFMLNSFTVSSPDVLVNKLNVSK